MANKGKTIKKKPIKDRFEKFIYMEPNSGCWLWMGGLFKNGYGQFKIGLKVKYAHRVSYEIYKGPIPEEMDVCHYCDIRSCANPDHVFLGTHKENIQDCSNKGRHNKPKGSQHHQAKLQDKDIIKIREDPRSQNVISKEFGVCQAQISNIKNHKDWKHL